jgi:hypothetical protein
VDDEMLAWLPPSLRNDAAAALAGIARPRGLILAIAGSDEAPYPLTIEGMTALMATQGWVPLATGAGGGCVAFRRA